MRSFLNRTRDWLTRPAVVLGLLAALLATQISSLWSPTPDGAGYMSIARSIARGGPAENMGSPKLHYPPGYPLLISPVMLTGDRPLLLLSIVQWFFTVVLMLGVHCWARRWLGNNGLWITALVMANAGLWINARTTLSEMSFMALLMWTANAMDELVRSREQRAVVAWCAVVGALTAALSMIRPVGVLIVTGYAAIVLWQARRTEITWRRALGTSMAAGLPATIAVLALISYESRAAQQLHDPTGTYLNEFKLPDVSLPAQLVEGVRIRVSEIGRLLVPGMLKAYAPPGRWWNINMAVYIPLFCALTWAWLRAARDCPSSLVLMVPCYLALYIVYPSDQGARYLLPLLPVFVLCLWWLIWQAPRQRIVLLSCLVGAHLVVSIATSVHGTQRLVRINSQWPDVERLVAVLREDHRPAITSAVPYGVRELALVSADRYILEPRADGNISADIAWVLTGAGANDMPGFHEYARAGELKLLERIEQVSRGRSPTNGR